MLCGHTAGREVSAGGRKGGWTCRRAVRELATMQPCSQAGRQQERPRCGFSRVEAAAAPTGCQAVLAGAGGGRRRTFRTDMKRMPPLPSSSAFRAIPQNSLRSRHGMGVFISQPPPNRHGQARPRCGWGFGPHEERRQLGRVDPARAARRPGRRGGHGGEDGTQAHRMSPRAAHAFTGGLKCRFCMHLSRPRMSSRPPCLGDGRRAWSMAVSTTKGSSPRELNRSAESVLLQVQAAVHFGYFRDGSGGRHLVFSPASGACLCPSLKRMRPNGAFATTAPNVLPRPPRPMPRDTTHPPLLG